MAMRKKTKKKVDKKIFRKTAIRTASVNDTKVVPRGGIRL